MKNIVNVVSVIVPLAQDSPIFKNVVEELDSVMRENFEYYEILIVDDLHQGGANAKLGEILTQIPNIRYLQLSRPVGRNAVQIAGIEASIGDFVVTFDPYCDPIPMIPDLVQECVQTGGVVQGVATNPHQRGFFREWSGHCFRKYLKKRLRVELRKGADEFRVMTRQAVNAFLRSNDHRFNLRMSTLHLGNGHRFVDYRRIPRPGEVDHRKFKGDLVVAISTVVAYSSHPLRFVGLLGVFLILASSLACATIIMVLGETGTEKSVPLTSLAFLTVVAITLIVHTATVGEYVLAAKNNPRPRPLYELESEQGSSILMEDSVVSSIIEERP